MPPLSKWARPATLWDALDMDLPSLFKMMKASLIPVVVVAMYQSTAVADISVTVGYLATLISITTQGLMPRAKFMKILFNSIISTCIAAAYCCLACYTAVRARLTGGDDSSATYNSSACAVSALWLIFGIWIANSLRAWNPFEMQDPMVAFSIFAVVTLTRAGTFTDVQAALDFIERLLKTFLIGFAVASACSLLVLPTTCRGTVFNDFASYTTSAEALFDSLVDFVQHTSGDAFLGADPGMQNHSVKAEEARQKLTATVSKLNDLESRIQSNLHYANIEIALGRLSGRDIGDIADLLQNLLRPLSGIGLTASTLDNFALSRPGRSNTTETSARSVRIMESMRDYCSRSRDITSASLQYFRAQLRLHPKCKEHCIEMDPKLLGESGMSSKLDLADPESIRVVEQARINLNSTGKQITRDILGLSDTDLPAMQHGEGGAEHALPQQEYFLVLHIISIWEIAMDDVMALAQFAHQKVHDKTLLRRRLVYPKFALLPFNWLFSWTKADTPHASQNKAPTVRQRGDGPRVTDPEHLEPANAWERFCGRLGAIFSIIGSSLSIFGMRVSAASFSIGILAFLQPTQDFFIRQRGVWAMIVVVIGMSPTSGQSFFGFFARIVASTCATILSLAAWYIVNGETPGVVVMLFLVNMLVYYVYVKMPQYFGPSVIAVVTLNVIVGYELQVEKIGIDTAESNGQPYYPIYIFGPYKLLAVIVGCAVSFFWVLFPAPISAKSKVPRLAGKSLFGLAKTYATMHATIAQWIDSRPGPTDNPSAVHAQLVARVSKDYQEELHALEQLKANCHFAVFEPPSNGKFPSAVYKQVINTMHNTLSILVLMSHIGGKLLITCTSEEALEEKDSWILRLRAAAAQSSEFQTQSLCSLFCHLASSMKHQQPLPPFLSVPAPFPLFRELQRLGGDIGVIRPSQMHIFRAFISLEVLRTMVHFELEKLLSDVYLLVGEVRFDV